MSTQRPRSFGLDLLRAFAIVAVLIQHEITVDTVPFFGALSSGVDLFFVLSGFLVGGIYFRESRSEQFETGRFWAARWMRTLPPYFGALVLYCMVARVFPNPALFPRLPLQYIAFLQNYTGVTGFAVSWSLCVEEHFYLALPLLGQAVAGLFGRRAFRYLLPVAFFVPLTLRFATYATLGSLPNRWFWETHLHCEAMIAGVWLAYLSVDEPRAFERMREVVRRWAPLWGVTLFATLVAVPVWHPGAGLDACVFTIYALGYGALVCLLHGMSWSPQGAPARALRWSVQGLALMAYSLYLTHTIVGPLLRDFAVAELHFERGVLRTGFVLVGVLLSGAAWFLLVERPSILVRNRLLHRERGQTLPVVVTVS